MNGPKLCWVRVIVRQTHGAYANVSSTWCAGVIAWWSSQYITGQVHYVFVMSVSIFLVWNVSFLKFSCITFVIRRFSVPCFFLFLLCSVFSFSFFFFLNLSVCLSEVQMMGSWIVSPRSPYFHTLPDRGLNVCKSSSRKKWIGYWHFLTTPCPSYSITLFSHNSPVVSMISVLSIRIQLPLTVDQFSVTASIFTWKKVCHRSSPYLHCTIRISNIHDLDMFLIFYSLSASYVPFWLSLLEIFFNCVFSLSWYFFRQSLSPVTTTSYPSNESVFRFLLLSKYS